ncbi:hypothetical protein ABK040_014394 [Willaertia magna]
MFKKQLWTDLNRSSETTPIDKIIKNIENVNNELLNSSTSSNQSEIKKVVLLSTGSYNPIHKMHVKTFYLAKKTLEQKYNMKVVGAFLSPSHDSYVESKLRQDYIPIKHRRAMAELSIKEEEEEMNNKNSDFLCFDGWESSVNGFIDFPQVTLSLSSYLKEVIPNENILVLYLCGSDHFFRCGTLHSLRNKEKTHGVGVCVLKRPSHHEGVMPLNLLLKPYLSSIYIVETTMEEDCSSTKIRTLAKEGKSISEFVYPSVEEYMRNNKIYYE